MDCDAVWPVYSGDVEAIPDRNWRRHRFRSVRKNAWNCEKPLAGAPRSNADSREFTRILAVRKEMMPGNWTQINSICSSRRRVALSQCISWADEGSEQCSAWADEGSNQCNSWADEGSEQCCTWAPCSWFCQAFYWVANWVCQAWYWVANWVCQAWYWLAKWVCVSWNLIYYFFCIDGNGGPMFLLTDGSVLMNECSGGFGTRRWWKLVPDTTGSYVNGQWSRMADSNNARKYFASCVLADGRLIVCGGEYSDTSGGNANDDTSASENPTIPSQIPGPQSLLPLVSHRLAIRPAACSSQMGDFCLEVSISNAFLPA